jgi:hypothetical protein
MALSMLVIRAVPEIWMIQVENIIFNIPKFVWQMASFFLDNS